MGRENETGKEKGGRTRISSNLLWLKSNRIEIKLLEITIRVLSQHLFPCASDPKESSYGRKSIFVCLLLWVMDLSLEKENRVTGC